MGGFHVTGPGTVFTGSACSVSRAVGRQGRLLKPGPSAVPRDPRAMPWGTWAGWGWFSDPHGPRLQPVVDVTAPTHETHTSEHRESSKCFMSTVL